MGKLLLFLAFVALVWFAYRKGVAAKAVEAKRRADAAVPLADYREVRDPAAAPPADLSSATRAKSKADGGGDGAAPTGRAGDHQDGSGGGGGGD